MCDSWRHLLLENDVIHGVRLTPWMTSVDIDLDPNKIVVRFYAWKTLQIHVNVCDVV